MITIPTMEPATTPEPGIYQNVPDAEYRKWCALSKSMVTSLLRSPAHLKAYLENNYDSAAKAFGRLFDTLVLEPETYEERFVMRPETYVATSRKDEGQVKPWNLRSSTCREIVQQLADSGKEVVAPEDMARARSMVESVRAHPEAHRLLSQGQKQVSILWQEPHSGALLKGRLDNLGVGRPDGQEESIDDLKSTRNASPSRFRRDMANYGYHIQAAMYMDGIDAITNIVMPYHIVAVESEPPYAVGVYAVREESLATGRELYRKASEMWVELLDSGNWYGYSQFIEDIDIPAYAISRTLEQGIYD